MASGSKSGSARRSKELAPAPLRLDVAGATTDLIGAQAGVSQAELDSLDERLSESIARLEGEREEGRRPAFTQGSDEESVRAIAGSIDRHRPRFERCVVLGGEGSELGARLLLDALDGDPDAPRVSVVPGADPRALREILDAGSLERTFFHVVSRAGESPELLASFLLLRDALVRELGAVAYVDHLFVSTDADAGPLRQIVSDEGLASGAYPAGVAGHESASSPAHLLGAMLAGVDVRSYFDGIEAMDRRCRVRAPRENPAAQLAALHYLLSTLHGVQTMVLFVQDPALAAVGEWWRHFWSATTAKRREGESSTVTVGATPVVAAGALARYTQLQVFLDGPADKLVAFVRAADEGGRAVELPRTYPDIGGVSHLGGQTLVGVESRVSQAMECAFARAERPTLSIELPTRSPHALGQLVRLFETTAFLTASLHDVDPHARPAAESVRRLAWGALGLDGYEADREELEQWAASRVARVLP